MSNNAATEDKLGELHNKVATVMTNALDQIEAAQAQFDRLVDSIDGEDEVPEKVADVLKVRPDVSPALLSAMTKFLADNHITCNDTQGKVSGLKETLANKRKRSVGNVIPFEKEA